MHVKKLNNLVTIFVLLLSLVCSSPRAFAQENPLSEIALTETAGITDTMDPAETTGILGWCRARIAALFKTDVLTLKAKPLDSSRYILNDESTARLKELLKTAADPRLLLPYKNLNTDVFEVVNVITGSHGGHRLILKRKVSWYDWRLDHSEMGGDITQDLRAFPAILGLETARFFGYQMIDEYHITVPDIDELNGAIYDFNESLPQNSGIRMTLSFYSESRHFASLENYVEKFVSEGKLPLSSAGRQFYHDISAHALEGFFVNNDVVTTLRARGKIWISLYKKMSALPLTPEERESLDQANADVMKELGVEIDQMATIITPMISLSQRIFLRKVGQGYVSLNELPQSLQKSYKDSMAYDTVFNGLSIDTFKLLYNNSLEHWSDQFKDNSPLKEKFQQALKEEKEEEPKLFTGLQFDLYNSLKDLNKAAAVSKTSIWAKALENNPFSNPYTRRLNHIHTLLYLKGHIGFSKMH